MPLGDANDRKKAQQRVDRIDAFQKELELLREETSLELSPAQESIIKEHHETLLKDLKQQYDIDTTLQQKQMSLGMRVVSFLGALALAASVFFFFYRIWGLISTPIQVLILIGTPILMLFALEFTWKREQNPYFTSLIGLVAFASFVLNLNLLGAIFNITPTQNVFLVWGAFAFLLAYAYNLWLLLVFGIICSLTYLSASMGTWNGLYWLTFWQRPENFLPAGFLLFLFPFISRQERHPDFSNYFRIFGLLTILLAVLILSHWGKGSYAHFAKDDVETFYQLLGFALAGITIWIGIHWKWSSITNLGGTFFVIDLYTKFYDWWWDWMPKYVFFFILGLIAIGLLVIFKRIRGHVLEKSL